EGEVAVETIAGHAAKMDYRAIASCVYTHPEVAWVGLTEEDAREEHPELKIGRFPFRILGRAIAAGNREGFVKVIAEPRYGEVLGVHMIGAHVTDLISEATLAMTLESTVDELIQTIHAHPTMPEAIGEAAMDAWHRAIHKAEGPPARKAQRAKGIEGRALCALLLSERSERALCRPKAAYPFPSLRSASWDWRAASRASALPAPGPARRARWNSAMAACFFPSASRIAPMW